MKSSSDVARMKVPIHDLKIQHATLKTEMDAALSKVIDDCAFILGPPVQEFETAFANYIGAKHCVGVSNGTDALKLALRAADVGEGDEVITAPHTFGATTEAICELGARPVFVDIEERSFTLDGSQLESKITERAKAIIPVHIYGHPADMDVVSEIAAKHDLVVIEDSAQAHGARYKGRMAGSFGALACFSFYPGKNLGAFGDAGGVVTSDDGLAERVRRLRNHGQAPGGKFSYLELGYNHRMDGIQGAVLGVKLPHLDTWNEKRREIAARYVIGLGEIEALTLPSEAPGAHHVYHLYVIRTPDRDRLAASLEAEGIKTSVYFPRPLHLTEAYRFLGYAEGALPVSEQACREVLSLPMFPEMEDDQVDYVVSRIRRHYQMDE